MIVGKEMFLDVDRKQVDMEMIECHMAVSSHWSECITLIPPSHESQSVSLQTCTVFHA